MIDFKISPGTAGNSDIPERFDDLPKHDIEVFQSENIQNILDAKSKKHKHVEVHYEIKKLGPEERKNLKKFLGEEFFETMTTSFEKSEAQDIGEQLENVKLALDNEDRWFALVIKEKNTTGLQGDETGQEKGSNYHALMRHTNKSEKEDISGGTFGKGSSVYTYSSGLWLWFAYSVLEKEWKDTKKRFVGRGMIAPFTDHENIQSYNGPCWYAREEKPKEGNREQGLPFVNDEADKQAEKFGLKVRDKKDIGTTYLIPVFWPDGFSKEEISGEKLFKSLRDEIIKRWFVSIYNDQLRCYINYEGLSEELTKNNLYSFPELNYKLEILDWYSEGADESNTKFKRKTITIRLPELKESQQEKIKKKYGKNIASRRKKAQVDLVLRILSPEEKSFEGFIDEDGAGTVNRVALTRNKGMIINHYPYDSRKNYFHEILEEQKFESILFAGKASSLDQSNELKDHLELFLGYAENPAHNEWIHKTSDLHRCNLKRFEGIRPTPAGVVNMLFREIDNAIIQAFPKDDKPPSKKEICSFWKKLYQLPSSGSDKGSKSPNFQYRTLNAGFDSDGKYVWDFSITSLNKNNKILLNWSPYLKSLQKPLRKQEEFNELGIPQFSEIEIFENERERDKIVLHPEEEKRIIIKTCPIKGNNKFKNLSPVLEVVDSII